MLTSKFVKGKKYYLVDCGGPGVSPNVQHVDPVTTQTWDHKLVPALRRIAMATATAVPPEVMHLVALVQHLGAMNNLNIII